MGVQMREGVKMDIKKLINLPLLLVCIVLLIVGYVLLGTGPVDSNASWKFAPVILVAVYVFLLPLSMILKK